MQATANQTLQDLAIMMTGTIEAIFEIAAINELAITDALQSGLDYIVPAGTVTDLPSLQYLQQNAIVVGTLANTLTKGIGLMRIGIDFTIN